MEKNKEWIDTKSGWKISQDDPDYLEKCKILILDDISIGIRLMNNNLRDTRRAFQRIEKNVRGK